MHNSITIDAAIKAMLDDRGVIVTMDQQAEDLSIKELKRLNKLGARFLVEVEPVPAAEPKPTPAKAGDNGSRAALKIDARKVAELKSQGCTPSEMADSLGVTPKQMSSWLFNHKAEVDRAVEELRCARELAHRIAPGGAKNA